jgi:hypothetical protein
VRAKDYATYAGQRVQHANGRAAVRVRDGRGKKSEVEVGEGCQEIGQTSPGNPIRETLCNRTEDRYETLSRITMSLVKIENYLKMPVTLAKSLNYTFTA